MIQFQQQTPLNWDLSTGVIDGIAPKTSAAPDIGMPIEDFTAQVLQLAEKGKPLEKVLSAIQEHPDITDKVAAENLAKEIYPTPTLENLAK